MPNAAYDDEISQTLEVEYWQLLEIDKPYCNLCFFFINVQNSFSSATIMIIY